MEEIIIEFDENGNVTMEGKGIEGNSCTVLMKEMEEALGKVKERHLKPEYHRPPRNARKVGSSR